MNFDNDILFLSGFFINALIFCLLTFLSFFYLKSLFPISYASNRSALKHPPMMRGLGVIYPFVLLISNLLFSLNNQIFTYVYLLILLTTLIGFYDDLKNISYRKKLITITLVFIVVSLLDNEILMFSDFNIIFAIIISLFFFLFYILFFNQIDGINGLSSGTFCIFLLALIFLKYDDLSSQTLFINILGISIAYFVLNMIGSRFFQGDAGAYFLGSVSYVLFKENEEFVFISLIFMFPIMGDIVWTTLMRLYFKYNLSKPHRNHLYQKSVSKIKLHFPITLCHIFIQTICVFLVYFLEIQRESVIIQFLALLLFGSFFSIVYVYTSFMFNRFK
jgi:UDP-GlcNAc:undecaprenyl-phosphate/decaprenyl-phosphate GlcNAc-1-phosphate transferase